MTHQFQTTLKVSTRGKALHNITAPVQQAVTQSDLDTGLCHLFVRHTSASLLIQENADPDVLKDLEAFFSHLVPEQGFPYRHAAEGPDDMPAHIRTALTQVTLSIPLCRGRLALGTWQGIYLWEHRQQGSQRQVILHLTGCEG
ncbi:YjbQ family protein [Synechococcales cyanobacterium C]|uniref:YjbQ family protein n=1 Tax=Petrachloros mirabilis ULC683 TaxID=2781853 RepID=A0A8K2A886_9CYAN|nr:YjbQ family protein [Petrachloros mirabilis ULC683]